MARVWERTTLWPVSTERDYFTTIVAHNIISLAPPTTNGMYVYYVQCMYVYILNRMCTTCVPITTGMVDVYTVELVYTQNSFKPGWV